MKISIITSTIDAEPKVRMTAASVAAQTHRDIEHIIVDGIERRSLDIPGAKVVSRPPRGVYNAINEGISLANGDVIGLLHGGDRFASEEVLSRVAEAFDNDPELAFVYGDIQFFNPDNERLGRVYRTAKFKPAHLAYGMAPPHLSLYLRRDVAHRIGPYKEFFRITGDLDMWMRLFNDNSLKYKRIDQIFVEMDCHGASSTFKNRLFLNNSEKLQTLRLNGYSANPLKLLGKYFLILTN